MEFLRLDPEPHICWASILTTELSPQPPFIFVVEETVHIKLSGVGLDSVTSFWIHLLDILATFFLLMWAVISDNLECVLQEKPYRREVGWGRSSEMFQALASVILLGSSASSEGSLTDLQNHLHAIIKSQCCAFRARLEGELFQVLANSGPECLFRSGTRKEVDFRGFSSSFSFLYSTDSAFIMTSVRFVSHPFLYMNTCVFSGRDFRK